LNIIEVYISLGSNIDPEKNILEAIRLLSDYVKILGVSTVYRTEPIGTSSQNDYYNCVLKVETDKEPQTLKFNVLRSVEYKMGRRRSDKYAPRTIDLDILLYGKKEISTKDMTIPDPNIMTRPFLALALNELDSTLILPNTKQPIKEVVNQFKNYRKNPMKEYTNALRDLIKDVKAHQQKEARFT
jgi:2-amino-4-hydroxy-6-hydroxymethyldihydropteridine diphosphokinase